MLYCKKLPCRIPDAVIDLIRDSLANALPRLCFRPHAGLCFRTRSADIPTFRTAGTREDVRPY